MNRSSVILIVVGAVFLSLCSGALTGGVAGFFAGRMSTRPFGLGSFRYGMPIPQRPPFGRPFGGQPNPNNVPPNQGVPRQPSQPAPNQPNQPIPPQNGFPGQRPPVQRNVPPFQQPNLPRTPDGRTLPTMQVVIAEVIKDSPAEQGGLQVNDVIVLFEGQNLTNPQQLTNLMRQHKGGDLVTLQVRRGNDLRALNIKLGNNPTGGTDAYLGVRLMLQPANPSSR